MAYYLVLYSIGINNTYDYPQSVKDVAWKSAVYHDAEQTMVGETDAVVKADGKQVVALTSGKATKLIRAYQSSYPELKAPIDLMQLQRN